MEPKKKTARQDFNASALVKTTEDHEERLSSLEEQVIELQARVGNSEVFGRTFCEAQKTDKSIDSCIVSIIDEHDNHKLKINVIAFGKWIGILALGGIIGGIITKLLGI